MTLDQLSLRIYVQLAHGDTQHRLWLRAKCDEIAQWILDRCPQARDQVVPQQLELPLWNPDTDPEVGN